MKRILVACEFSGIVREACRALGHDAWSCDLLPAEDGSPFHIQGDVLRVLSQPWDAMIAFPPCTYLTNSGVRWLHTEAGRWDKMHDAARFFRMLLNADIARILIENPIPHKYALEGIGRKYDQIIHPWQHGHGETKATCIWRKGVSEILPSNVVSGRNPRVHHASPGPNRWKERSRTLPGIGNALALAIHNSFPA